MTLRDKRLTDFSRRKLTEIYAFAAIRLNCPASQNLRLCAAELLAFAPDEFLADIAERLNHETDPAGFLVQAHGAWHASCKNPARLLTSKMVRNPQPLPMPVEPRKRRFSVSRHNRLRQK